MKAGAVVRLSPYLVIVCELCSMWANKLSAFNTKRLVSLIQEVVLPDFQFLV